MWKLTLYPYLAISFWAKSIPETGFAPSPPDPPPAAGGGDAELSVKEGGGAIAIPPAKTV